MVCSKCVGYIMHFLCFQIVAINDPRQYLKLPCEETSMRIDVILFLQLSFDAIDIHIVSHIAKHSLDKKNKEFRIEN